MNADIKTSVNEIRSFNRFYTDILGLLNKYILESEFSLTEARILLEINLNENCTSNKLMTLLNVDKGYLSRILKKFDEIKLIKKIPSNTDGRLFNLSLTHEGERKLQEIHDKSNKQIEKLIDKLNESELDLILSSMNSIETILKKDNHEITIRRYNETDLDYIITRHLEIYKSEYCFGPEFEYYVKKYILQFNENHDDNSEAIWIAESNGKRVGAIALVKVDEETAQLRWFIIEPDMRGKGLGNQLMKTLIEFCKEKKYTHVFLWTVSILKTARHLYEKYNFSLTESKPNNDWGLSLIDERWDLYL